MQSSSLGIVLEVSNNVCEHRLRWQRQRHHKNNDKYCIKLKYAVYTALYICMSLCTCVSVKRSCSWTATVAAAAAAVYCFCLDMHMTSVVCLHACA